MGSYDCRCMLTGVSLNGIDATAVVLQRSGGVYLPITLGITGAYGFGGIEVTNEDLNTQLVFEYFTERHRDGRLFANDQTSLFNNWLASDSNIDELLFLIERTNSSLAFAGEKPSTVLDGDAIFLALIAQPIWDAVTTGSPAPDESPVQQFQRVFSQVTAATEMYRHRLTELTTSLGNLAAVNAFVAVRGLRWAAVSEESQRYPTLDYGGQHGHEDIRDFLERAERDYHNDPVVMTGLAAYEQLIDWE